MRINWTSRNRVRKNIKLIWILTIASIATLACLTTQTAAVLTVPTTTPVTRQAKAALDTSQTPEPKPLCAIVSAHSLHIRNGPNHHAQVMGWLQQGASADLLAPTNETGWAKVHAHGIQFDGKKARLTGYVKAEFITITICPGRSLK